MFYQFHKISILFLALLLLNSCSGTRINAKKPESVAVGFAKLFSQLDFQKAKKYTTAEGQQLLQTMDNFLEDQGLDREEQIDKMGPVFTFIESATCTVEGDKAMCTLCCDEQEKPLSGTPPMELHKKDGKWYVHLSKENFFE